MIDNFFDQDKIRIPDMKIDLNIKAEKKKRGYYEILISPKIDFSVTLSTIKSRIKSKIEVISYLNLDAFLDRIEAIHS